MKAIELDNAVYSTMENTYWRLEKSHRSPHRRTCINGKITGSNKCVGYCKYYGHPGFLTKELRQEHKCLQKGCYYYLEKERDPGPFVQRLILPSVVFPQ